MQPLRNLLKIFFSGLLLTFTLITAAPANAAGGPPVLFELIGGSNFKTVFDYGKEFCDKRSGDLMNLETWYSGKCSPGVDTLSGEGVGFSDIVMLQGVEYLIGPQYNSFLDLIINIVKGLGCVSNPSSCLSTSQSDLDSLNQGLVPALSKIAGSMFTVRPASSLDYIAYVSNNLKSHEIVKEAWAVGPGYGFTALSPILPLWRAFRNIAYVLFALGFVLYGIMIMFRVRIDAKTAASIQLAIPKLIFTLILITFSYAIVGLLVDISTIAVAMSVNVLRAGGILTTTPNPLVDMASGQFMGAVGSFIVNGFSAVVVSPFIAFNLLIGGGAGAILAGVIGVGSLGLIPMMGFIGWVLVIIVILAVGYSMLKLVLKLFQAYFSIIVNLIFAPVILLGNLMPGADSFGSWLRNIYGNLAVFPVASFFLVLSYALMAQPFLSLLGALGIDANFLGVEQFSTLNNIWTPPMTVGLGITGTGANQQVGQWFGGSLGSLMLATIGFGLLMMSSKYVEMVEKALKVPPFPYGAAIGEALKSGVGLQDAWAKGGYQVPLPGRLAPYGTRISGTLGTTVGQHGGQVKPAVDAFTSATK